MSEFKGTKGKWTRYSSIIPNQEEIKHSVYHGTSRISLCFDLFEHDKSKNVPIKEAKYNAQLIAHAPQMLEMLKRLTEHLEFEQGYNSAITEQAKQLIQQATTIK